MAEPAFLGREAMARVGVIGVTGMLDSLNRLPGELRERLNEYATATKIGFNAEIQSFSNFRLHQQV